MWQGHFVLILSKIIFGFEREKVQRGDGHCLCGAKVNILHSSHDKFKSNLNKLNV